MYTYTRQDLESYVGSLRWRGSGILIGGVSKLFITALGGSTTTRFFRLGGGMYPAPHARIQLFTGIVERLQILHAAPGAEEVLRAQSSHVARCYCAAALQSAISLLPPDVFAHRAHGGISAGLFDVGARHTRRHADQVVEVKVLVVDFGVAENQGEDVVSLRGRGEAYGEFLGHTAENGLIYVLDAIRGAENAYPLGLAAGRGCEAVPVGHELGLDHAACFVLARSALSQDGVNLVDEDNARLQLPCQAEDGVDELVGVAVPLLRQGGDVQIDEAGAGLVGEGLGEHRLAAAGGPVKEQPEGAESSDDECE
jgi:hypothetical protein